MKKHAIEMWVGVFMTLGLLSLVFLSFQVAGHKGAGSDASDSYTLYADFDDIGGLKVKAPVKTSGVVVGRVANIAIEPESYRARVTMRIAKGYLYSDDATARILTSGILGEQYVALLQGGSEEDLQDGQFVGNTVSALVLENLIGNFVTGMMRNEERK